MLTFARLIGRAWTAYQKGNNVIFENSNHSWDAYNIRYKSTKGDAQVENSSGNYKVLGVGKHRTVKISVQGTNRHYDQRKLRFSTGGTTRSCRLSFRWRPIASGIR